MHHPLVKFTVLDLDAGGKELDYALPCAWLGELLADSEVRALSDGHFSGRASKSGDRVVVVGNVEAELLATCGRCLGPARMNIREALVALFVSKGKFRGAGHEEEEYEFSDEEAEMLPLEGDEAVLDEVVRDTILLEIPMTPLCSDTCPGMTARSDVRSTDDEPKQLDPRLAPLLKIRTQVKE